MPARNRMHKVYSVYHAMDDRGVFEQNKANVQSVNNDGLSMYEGPVQYPKMLYDPKGELYCINQGIMIVDRDNRPVFDEQGKVKYAGSVWGVKNIVVDNAEQEEEMVKKGWHFTEAQALRANPTSPIKAPPKSPAELQAERIADLEKKLAEFEAKAPKVPSPQART